MGRNILNQTVPRAGPLRPRVRSSLLRGPTPRIARCPVWCLVLCLFVAGCSGPGADGGSPRNSGQPPGTADYLSLTFDVLGAFPVPEPAGNLPSSGRAPNGSRQLAPRAGYEPAAVRSSPNDPASLVPPEIRDLNGRKIAILGYMVPVDYEAEGTNRFVLLKCTLACCYGKLPRVNEWIDVTMEGGKRVPFYQDEPVWVYGRLEVAEEIEGGNLVGLYWLHADKLTKPKTP
jgi:hypothetical protein